MRTLWFACFVIILLTASVVTAQVIINEVLYDTGGNDDPDLLFTELYGHQGTSLDGYSLVGINGNGGSTYRTVPLSGEIPADGYFVVGNTSNVTNVDLVVGGGMLGVNWQNAGDASGPDCDCLHLKDSQGTVIDKVQYGECEAGNYCEGEGGTWAPDPYPSGGVDYSIGRLPDHQDTDDNGADWGITDALTPGESNSGEDTCIVHYYTISQVQEDNADGTPLHAGEFVHIIGMATIDNYILSPTSTSFYIQDEDAGVNIYGSNGPAEVAVSDCVIVRGWITHYNGLTEIVTSGTGNCTWDLEVVTTGPMPEPILVTCNTISTLGEDFEGMLVRINGVHISGGDPWPPVDENANIEISDGTGTCVMRIDKDTDIDGQTAPPASFDVIGIANQYDFNSPYTEGYQILPRYYDEDILFVAADDVAAAVPENFKLLGCFPNPFNAATRISFSVGHRSDVSVRIFDLLGREVMHASVSVPSAGEYSYIWNGTNISGESVSTGLYLVRLQAGNESITGKLLYLK